MDLINAKWRKASRSSDNGGHCVEVASVSGTIAIRDSKAPNDPKILVSREDFRRFAETLKNI